jgi:hypothetical protein
MPDTLETLFARVREVQPPAPYLSAHEIRRRGRRSAYGRRLAVGGAVLAVGGLGAGTAIVAADGPSPSPTPLPVGPTSAPVGPTPEPVDPTPAPSPPSRLLQAGDLGPGRWEQFSAEILDNADRWGSGSLCEYESADYRSLAHQEAVETIAWRRPGVTVTEVVEQYAAGWGGPNLDDVRAVVAACDRPELRLTVVDTGFAGDGSLLVREEAGGLVMYHVVVQVRDRVATVRVTADEAYARDVGVRAAARLA